MQSPDRERVRAVYERWGRGDFNTPEIFDPEIRTYWAAEIPDLHESRGLDGLAHVVQEWIAPWEECVLEAESIYGDGDRLLVLARIRGRHRESAAQVEWRVGHVWTMRDGKAVELRGYASQEEAVRASGIAVP